MTQKSIEIVEVGPRDGLQNETQTISPEVRVELIQKLIKAGHKRIEVGSFVSKKWVPQMAQTGEVLEALKKIDTGDCRLSVIVPNEQGLDESLKHNVTDIAILAAASETFSQKNTNHSIKEMLEIIDNVVLKAKKENLHVRGYISCVLGCPYEGHIEPQKVVKVANHLRDMGVDEISLGDTIGTGYPAATDLLLKHVLEMIPHHKLAVHFHDTYGQALANIAVALNNGVHIIDSSVAGLGGCPYASGASGNVATEDVLYTLQDLETAPNIDMHEIMRAGGFICNLLEMAPRAKVSRAMLGRDALAH